MIAMSYSALERERSHSSFFVAGQEWVAQSSRIERRFILSVEDGEITYIRERDRPGSPPNASGTLNFRSWVKSSRAIDTNWVNARTGALYAAAPAWIKERVTAFYGNQVII
ncbi:hypothetical protein KOE73_14600 [Acidomonas methanolica]|uniref:Uncharacterized protein n=2 Tax=Acidomonas methanolica TaxID=437 RepID=A0A023D4X1_ACIMT|nr:hypothetical protein [Acidomonas methanolica]MBU2655582.1 hypothetical protein [Acidomonas methanolica]TCS20574.1 hypothetical protein EDC31_1434 [Acidomonas methanolica]GAJ29188.1 hypothetical protein Amme_051_004 [Acidomonas methanolica NBRC 104435]GBQ45457.1 hypothetical protein AA0498_0058 [Acidomonas methanolica]GEL00568.1 hypothetical protein AME01nite_30660 [Acidomonas methanolica NBRC 104435]